MSAESTAPVFAPIPAAAPKFDIGRAFAGIVTAAARDWPVLLACAAVAVMVPDAVLTLTRPEYAAYNSGAARISPWWGGMAEAFSFSLVSGSVLYICVCQRVLSDMAGQREGLGGMLRALVRFYLPVFVIQAAALAGEMAGFVLLIVPGVILSLAWYLIVPVQLMERRGLVATFQRSAELTRNHRGALFGLLLALGLATGLLFGILPRVLDYALQGSRAGALAAVWINAVFQGLGQLANALAVPVVYHQLRTLKEGAAPDSLAAVFD